MNEDRIVALSEKLAAARDARAMSSSHTWADAWNSFEQELLERLLKCEPTEDEQRYRLQVAIEATRRVRGIVEHRGATVAGLEKDLDHLEGRRPRTIA